MNSAEITFFLVLAAIIVVFVVGGCVVIFVRPKIQLRRERRRLEVMSVSAVAAETYAGYERSDARDQGERPTVHESAVQ